MSIKEQMYEDAKEELQLARSALVVEAILCVETGRVSEKLGACVRRVERAERHKHAAMTVWHEELCKAPTAQKGQ